jgi:hypothetical protein
VAISCTYKVGDNVTITSSETSLAVDGGSTTLQTVTDIGVYTLLLDGVGSMAKGDEYRWRVYEKAHANGTKRVIMSGTISDAQSEPVMLPNLMLGLGWDITLQRISATSRAFYWSIRRVS